MIDFRKRLNRPKIEKETNPIEIYKTLDRRSIAGNTWILSNNRVF